MSARRRLNRNVDPRIVAIAIVAVLAVIQYVWWRGLVYKPPGAQGRGGGSGGGAGPTFLFLLGLRDARVDTLAGMEEPGAADGVGRLAQFDGPTGIAVGSNGVLYVADTRNNRIRTVQPDGVTSTLAGSIRGCRDGDAASAEFDGPSGVAAAPDGTVYVADTNNGRIRAIRDGSVTTVGGGASSANSAGLVRPVSVAVVAASGAPALLVADAGTRSIQMLALGVGTAQPRTVAALPNLATAVAADGSGFAATLPDSATIQVGAARAADVPVSDLEGTPTSPHDTPHLKRPMAICRSPRGWYVADAGQGAVVEFTGAKATVIAGACCSTLSRFGFLDGTGEHCAFGIIGGLAADTSGHIYVADTKYNAIRRITLNAPSNVADVGLPISNSAERSLPAARP